MYDDSMYVAWLQQEHPDDLPNGLELNNSLADVNEPHSQQSVLDSVTSTPVSELVTKANESDSTAANEAALPRDESCRSTSKSLSQTRELISKFKEYFGEPSTTKSKSKSTARVLTSAKSLTALVEKEKKKREEEEQKAKRKEEREKKRKEKEEEKKRKAELKKKKEEERAKLKTKKTGKSVKKATVAAAAMLQPSSDSEIEAAADNDCDEYGIQNNEISNNEYAVCFGLYQDDLSSAGKLMTEWVECTNNSCKKWMHSQCLKVDNELYMCEICGCSFS